MTVKERAFLHRFTRDVLRQLGRIERNVRLRDELHQLEVLQLRRKLQAAHELSRSSRRRKGRR